MICNECETVAHCTKHGCVPKKDNSNYRYDPPVAEPVAWMFPDDLKRFETSETYAEAYSIKMGSPTQGQTVPLYTTPPAAQRQWVGLTDEERDAIFELHHTRLGGWDHGGDEVMYDKHFEDAVAAIEAKLKEKNYG